jgi:uncharacterized transporter YbjL
VGGAAERPGGLGGPSRPPICEEVTRHHTFNPRPDRPLQAGDVLITCADHHQLETLRKIVTEG